MTADTYTVEHVECQAQQMFTHTNPCVVRNADKKRLKGKYLLIAKDKGHSGFEMKKMFRKMNKNACQMPTIFSSFWLESTAI